MVHALEDPEKQKKKKKKKEASKDEEEMGYNIAEAPPPPPPPPDGGWGWAVVFASFMIHVMTDGVTYAFGVVYVELLNYFGEGDARTSWIASILVGVTLCSGPISSMLVNRYGCRAVTIAGAILSSICLLLSIFAQNVTTLYFTIGIGTGLGFGLIYLPAIVCVTIYFEKLRSFATGIAVCGSGVGTLIFAPTMGYLIDEFGWRGALLITSAILLNCIIFGILFRPIEPIKQPTEIPLEIIKNPSDSVPQTNGVHVNGFKRPHSVTNVNQVTYHFPINDNDSSTAMRVAMSHPTLNNTFHRNFRYQSLGSGIMNKKDIFYQGSLENIDPKRSELFRGNEDNSVRVSWKSLPNGIQPKQNESIECAPGKEGILKNMLDLSLLMDPIFLVFVLSNFCTSIGFSIPYLHLIPQAVSRSHSKSNAGFLISVVGIANTIGRIVLGYVSDKPWINRLLVYNFSLTICGVSTMLSAFCDSYFSFVLYASAFGFTIGAYVGLTSVILVDLLGLDRLTNAFGLLLLFQGVASLVGPPIAGWLHDTLHYYDPGFYSAGAMIALSGVMLFLIPPLQKREKRNEERLKVIIM